MFNILKLFGKPDLLLTFWELQGKIKACVSQNDITRAEYAIEYDFNRLFAAKSPAMTEIMVKSLRTRLRAKERALFMGIFQCLANKN